MTPHPLTHPPTHHTPYATRHTEKFDADPLTQPPGPLQDDDVVLEEEVKRDLSRLLGEGGGLREGVESYQEEASLAPSDRYSK